MQIGSESLNNPFFSSSETGFHPVLRANGKNFSNNNKNKGEFI